MRIALVSLQFEETSTGGGGVHVKHMSDQFIEAGQEVTVVSIHTNKTLPQAKLEKHNGMDYSLEVRGALTVVRFLIDEGIDHPYVGEKDVELDRIKRFADTAVKWLKEEQAEFDIISPQGHHLLPGYMAKELQGIKPKIISYIHALETTYVTKDGSFVGAFEGTASVLEKIRQWEAMCRFADYVIVNSPQVRDEFKKIIEEADADAGKYFDRIVLISSGCDESFLMEDDRIMKKFQHMPETINLVTFCRVDPSKGIEYSIDGARSAAAASTCRYCLTIAGMPSSEEYITKLKTELDNIPGNLEIKFLILDAISPEAEKKEILDDKHIYILPTLKEPFGMSVIEASARGNMALSADTNGPKFMFESESGKDTDWGIITDFGILAKITDDHQAHFAQNVGKAIIWMIENWQGSVDRVLKFNEKIRKLWTWEGICKQYMELFKNSLA